MEGVTVLNQIVTKEALISPWLEISSSLCIIGFVGVVIFGVMTTSDVRFSIPLILASLCLLAGVCIGAFGPCKNETHYQVTISDEVNFNEFNEKYEIIEQNGLIYTVREREPK
jgi:tetrahydromethanopterin S-methyltransferase subunit E